ncbi:MAG: hypothetical protein AAGB26_08190 [Planctomycetota bacterium]
MSVQQDRFTFFGVLIAVVIVVLGYLQLSQLYPVTGRADDTTHDATDIKTDTKREAEENDAAPLEGDAQP